MTRRRTRYLLINPARNYIRGCERKVCTQPLGLSYVAAALRAAGYQVAILDATVEGYDNESPARNGFIRYGLSPEEIRKRIKAYAPDVVGVGAVQSLQLYEAYEVFDIVKALDPEIVTLFGGAHASAMYEKEAAQPNIDFVVVGEGELTIVTLAKRLEEGPVTGDVPGVAYMDGDRLRNAPGQRLRNLDELPFPAYDLLPMDKYHLPGASPSSFSSGRVAIMQTSRGCPHNCRHCPKNVVFGHTYRRRSINHVIAEVLHFVNSFDINEIHIEDSNFTIDRKRVLDFCARIQALKLDLKFSLPHGIEVNTLDRELLQTMFDTGFNVLHLSIESVNDAVLKTQDKSLVPDKIRNVIVTAKDIGYLVTGYFMLGFPDERMSDMRQTVDFAKALPIDKVNFFIYTPLPGTPIYEECLASGLLKEGFDITHLRYGWANIDTKHFTHQDLQNMRRDAWKEIMADRKSTCAKA